MNDLDYCLGRLLDLILLEQNVTASCLMLIHYIYYGSQYNGTPPLNTRTPPF